MAARSGGGSCSCQDRSRHRPGGSEVRDGEGKAAFAMSPGLPAQPWAPLPKPVLSPLQAQMQAALLPLHQFSRHRRAMRAVAFCLPTRTGHCSRHCCAACEAFSVAPSFCRNARLAHWPAEWIPPCHKFAYVFPRRIMPAGYLAAMLAPQRLARKASAQKCHFPRLTCRHAPRSCAPHIAPSSNGKTTDSDSVYRGSNPRGASIFSEIINIYRLVLAPLAQSPESVAARCRLNAA